MAMNADPRTAHSRESRSPAGPVPARTYDTGPCRPTRCKAIAIPGRRGIVVLVLACLLGVPAATDDPYQAWAQGRPAESLPRLIDAAATADTPAAWGDAGLVAAEAGRRPLAIACLARSLVLAPLRTDTRQALRVLAVRTPRLWSDLVGPVAHLGSGWTGLVLATAGGLLLGVGLMARHRRKAMLGLGAVCLLACLPGLLSTWRDASLPLAVTRSDCALLDASGRPQRTVAGGSILLHHDRPPWQGKLLVEVADGTTGFLATGDLTLIQRPDTLLEQARRNHTPSAATPPPTTDPGPHPAEAGLRIAGADRLGNGVRMRPTASTPTE